MCFEVTFTPTPSIPPCLLLHRAAFQATSAALGYLLLFVDQVALIMGGPMLHESAHQASTSSIWQPSSFWNRRPASPTAMLPLNVMTAGTGAGSGTGQAAYNSTTSRCVWRAPAVVAAGGLCMCAFNELAEGV
jgi:hypothetical protein